jgi:hypothetical protein
MARANTSFAPQPQRYQGGMFPAPLKGLTVRYTLNAQDANTALLLRNVLCRRYGVELRRGYRRWMTGIPGEVRSLMSYLPARGAGSTMQPRLWAAASDGIIYEVTAQQVTPTDAVTPFLTVPNQSTPGVFSWTNFSAGGQNYLVACSAGGGVWTFEDSAGWIDRTAGITGTDASKFDFVMVWKNRLWFIALNSNIAWYLPVLAFQGVAQPFDFGPLLVFGGDLAAMASWTLDAGDGVDDKLVVVGRGGDVLVYEGTDPATPGEFRIAGRWAVGRVPVGRRFMSKYGGDLSIITPNGIERMSQLTSARGLNVPAGELGGTEDWVRYMERIAQDVRGSYQSPFWQLLHFMGEQCAIIITPHNGPQDGLQYVFGTLSGGWSEFSGIPMLSIEAHDGELYFGTKDGKVMQMFFGTTDDSLQDGTPGTAVVASVQTSFVALSSDEFHTKRPLMVMPMFIAPSAPSVKAQVNTDWSFQPIPGSPIYSPRGLAVWDSAQWDNAIWAGSGNFYNAWVGAEGLGTHCSLRMDFTGESPGTIFTTWKLLAEVGQGVL